MLYVTVERTVRHRPEVVWGALTDLSALTVWAEGIVEARLARGSPEGAGAVIELQHHDGRTRRNAKTEVTVWREPSLVALETRTPEMLLFHRVTLAATSAGTALGLYAEILVHGLVSDFLARPRGLLGGASADPPVHSVHERSVDAFVKYVETSRTVPYR